MKILCISPSLPIPITGGRTHTYNVLKNLSHSNIIGLVANEDKEIDSNLKNYYQLDFLEFVFLSNIRYTSSFIEKILSILGFWMEFRRFDTVEHKKNISNSLIRDQYDLILVEELCELAPTLKVLNKMNLPRIPLIACVAHNDEALLTKSKGNNKNFIKKFLYYVASLSIQRYQTFWLSKVDILITLTENDSISLNKTLKKNPKFCYKLGNGIDTKKIELSNDKINVNYSKYLFFMGDLSYPPNKAAIEWFISKVLPDIPYEIEIIGMPPKDSVFLSYLKNNPKVHYEGLVKDVSPYILNAWCCLAPIFSGSGSRLKILEYLSLGKPVISTSLGIQGLNLTNGMHFLLANTVEEFINCILLLERDHILLESLSKKGREYVLLNYDWQVLVSKMEIYLNEIVAERNIT